MNQKPMYQRSGALLGALMCLILMCLLPLSASAETAYVYATQLMLRKQPRADGAAITQIPRGQAVTVLAQAGEWTKVTYKSHKGYVYKGYLVDAPPEEWSVFDESATPKPIATKKPAATAKPTATAKPAATAKATAAAKPAATPPPNRQPAASPTRNPDTLRLGDAGEKVRTLQNELRRCGYDVSADGIFGVSTETALIAFQRSQGLAADGLAGEQTRTRLAAAPSAKIKPAATPAPSGVVEKLDWWSGGATAFPVGKQATVVDVRSGLRFTVKRWGGVNHADVEPLTAADSAIMKKAYGGEWSWERRPIWVIVGGRVIAASMNGMPHMGYSILDNGFDGHFCIHMLNSRTHGSNRIDEGHQAAVTESYNKRLSFRQ